MDHMRLIDFLFAIAAIFIGIAFEWGRGMMCSDPWAGSLLLWASAAFFAILGPAWAYQAKNHSMVLRSSASIGTAILAIVALIFALSHKEACAQGINQTNQSGPNINVPGNGNTINTPYLVPTQSGQTIINNSGGGVGADISAFGSAETRRPTVGLETNGLVINQTGAGIGARINVGGTGPAVGVISHGPVIINAQ
jgi:hypothetical protein